MHFQSLVQGLAHTSTDAQQMGAVRMKQKKVPDVPLLVTPHYRNVVNNASLLIAASNKARQN